MQEESLGHISTPFNTELEAVHSKVLQMGGVVEAQVRDACKALLENDAELAEKVYNEDFKVNAFEVEIDEQCTSIIARRQPTASDLRLIVSVFKTITDLERIGDESGKIARMARALADMKRSREHYFEILHLSEHVRKMLHDALDAFARTDVDLALKVVAEDEKVDQEYEALVRQLITLMMEDARSVRRVLNTLWSARSLERIGDHAKNICEYVIYLVKGKDVRHTTLEKMQDLAK